MGICFPYLGEFQPTKYREKILCWMEMFWTVGIIALPGLIYWLNESWPLLKILFCILAIAWLIIPLEVEIQHGWFLFHSWNLFVAICAIPRYFILWEK